MSNGVYAKKLPCDKDIVALMSWLIGIWSAGFSVSGSQRKQETTLVFAGAGSTMWRSSPMKSRQAANRAL
jgi:hypothetical protein